MLTSKDVEKILYEAFPKEDAASWDRPGLLVEHSAQPIHKICCALDPTVENITKAHERAAELLVTHHPCFLSFPDKLSDNILEEGQASAALFAAIKHNVSLIGMHTNLDVSTVALNFIEPWLDMSYIEPLHNTEGFGGQYRNNHQKTVYEITQELAQNFNTHPRLYGNKNMTPALCAWCSGSIGSLGFEAVQEGCSCIITGECGYHHIQEITQAGASVILLGHDASEKPFANLLAQTLTQALSCENIEIEVIDEPQTWCVVE